MPTSDMPTDSHRLAGPRDTAYQGGLFKVDIILGTPSFYLHLQIQNMHPISMQNGTQYSSALDTVGLHRFENMYRSYMKRDVYHD